MLMDAHYEWLKRPMDERFIDLDSMLASLTDLRDRSREIEMDLSHLRVTPSEGDETGKGLLLLNTDSGNTSTMTNHAFGQLSVMAGAPKGYLATLPAQIAADAMNYGLETNKGDAKLLITGYGKGDGFYRSARAFTGPDYGRIWNSEIVHAIRSMFGNGLDGQFRIPHEFGDKNNPITKQSTTLYAGDRDCFLFLADEDNRIELPNRRDGKTGTLARGFFVRNSDVGYSRLEITWFLFDYMCGNHIVWGATDVKTVSLRHRSGIMERFSEDVAPVLTAYANSATVKSLEHLKSAQAMVIDSDKDKVLEFLSGKFGTMKLAKSINKAHNEEEGRDISTIWDAVTGATAFAKSVPFTDERVEIETKAGKLLTLVS